MLERFRDFTYFKYASNHENNGSIYYLTRYYADVYEM